MQNAYSEFNGCREEVDASFFGNYVTAGNTGQVDKGRFHDALLALDGFEDGLGESTMQVS